MKNFFSINSVVVLVCAILSLSCQKIEQKKSDVILLLSKSQLLESINPYLIPKEKKEIDEKDARTIASHLEFSEVNTRSQRGKREIESVDTIYGEDRKPVMFVVNFADDKGFTLISATKSFYPILAEVEKGSLSQNRTGSGMDDYLAEYEYLITHSSEISGEDADQIRNAWARFEEKSFFDKHIQTRASNEEEALFWSLCDVWISNMESQGYEVYPLLCYPDEMPTDSLLVFQSNAQTHINPEFNYLDHSFIVVSRTGATYYAGPYDSSSWSQDSPYRDNLPSNVVMGCGTIAVGLVMKYFRYPTSFSWDDMPSWTATDTTKQFLYRLHYQVSNSDGGSSITSMDDCLHGYGYSTSTGPYNMGLASQSILNNHVIIMTGVDNNYYPFGGHAWVCSGYRYSDEVLSCRLFVPISRAGSNKLIMQNVYSDTISVILPRSFYMNWGFGGSGNGWFLNSSVAVGNYNFSSLRQMIYNITPGEQ